MAENLMVDNSIYAFSHFKMDHAAFNAVGRNHHGHPALLAQ